MGKPYTPTEVVFAPTVACNLACAHCRVNRARERTLTIDAALAFLDDCANHGIERVGFSGGEPFLESDFVARVCERAIELELMFDRLMTNGDWWKDEADLDARLGAILDAGFDGTIGLSADEWHGQDPLRLATFIARAEGLGAGAIPVEIVSVTDRGGKAPDVFLSAIAKELSGKLERDRDTPVAIAKRRDGGPDISITIITYSAAGEPAVKTADEGTAADAPAGWNADGWFDDDWCVGPGNVLYVHPDAQVAVCCGFANEREELIAGTVADGVEKLVANARATPFVRSCYESGLGVLRRELEARGITFPGKTRDICLFCEWVCKAGYAPSSRQGL
ncbi:MAG TPA: radical SAM protein [Treponemataceae bacterium]|nr:radical SAM protein [Treponemataceae bacterium]